MTDNFRNDKYQHELYIFKSTFPCPGKKRHDLSCKSGFLCHDFIDKGSVICTYIFHRVIHRDKPVFSPQLFWIRRYFCHKRIVLVYDFCIRDRNFQHIFQVAISIMISAYRIINATVILCFFCQLEHQLHQIVQRKEIKRILPVVRKHHFFLFIHAAENVSQEIFVIDTVSQIRQSDHNRRHFTSLHKILTHLFHLSCSETAAGIVILL